MNVCQSIPRRDCKVFAKCGAKSLSHCRRHREIDEKCKSCTLIRRKPRNRIIDDSGREMKNVPLRKSLLLEPVLQSYSGEKR